MTTNTIPTEDQEQAALVQYLRLKNMKFFRVPNETYTTSWKQKRKNKELGVVKGVPDIFVIKGRRLLAIEMKRTKGGRVSPEQKDWIEILNGRGVADAKVCYGAKDAIEFIERVKGGGNED